MANVQTEDVKQVSEFPLLPGGTSIDAILVLAAGSLYLSTEDQLRAQLAGPAVANPTVTLVVPEFGLVGVPVTFVATPVAAAGATVTRVDFYVGSRKVGQVTQAPWAFNYTPATATQPGERPFVVTAVVFDSNMAQGTSRNYGLTVSQPAAGINQAPVVTISVVPRNPVAGQTLAIAASATDPDGTITRMELYDYGRILDDITTSPYTFEVVTTDADIGQHYYSVKAYDNLNLPTQTPGLAVTIAPVTTPVDPNTPSDLPSYYGPVETTEPSADEVQALQSELWVQAPRVLHFSCNGTFPAFIEPQSHGIRNVILDGSARNITGDVDRFGILLDIDGVEVDYWAYVLVNPQYTPDFQFSL